MRRPNGCNSTAMPRRVEPVADRSPDRAAGNWPMLALRRLAGDEKHEARVGLERQLQSPIEAGMSGSKAAIMKVDSEVGANQAMGKPPVPAAIERVRNIGMSRVPHWRPLGRLRQHDPRRWRLALRQHRRAGRLRMKRLYCPRYARPERLLVICQFARHRQPVPDARAFLWVAVERPSPLPTSRLRSARHLPLPPRMCRSDWRP